jgi:hypothetical protein
LPLPLPSRPSPCPVFSAGVNACVQICDWRPQQSRAQRCLPAAARSCTRPAGGPSSPPTASPGSLTTENWVSRSSWSAVFVSPLGFICCGGGGKRDDAHHKTGLRLASQPKTETLPKITKYQK